MNIENIKNKPRVKNEDTIIISLRIHKDRHKFCKENNINFRLLIEAAIDEIIKKEEEK